MRAPLFYADVMEQEDFDMNSIIKDLRASLARENDIETDLPDGSSLTVPEVDTPDEAVEEVFNVDEDILALENDIDIDEKVLEALITNGEILSDIDIALECFKYSGLGMDDLTYTALQRTYNRVAGNLRLPSIENMLSDLDGDRTLLRLATEAAVSERVGDILKKIIEKVMALFHKIKDWYIRIFDQASVEKRRALKIVKVSGSITGAPTDVSVTMGSVGTLGIGNKSLQPSIFLNHLNEIDRITEVVTTKISKEWNQLLAELTTLTKAQISQIMEANKKRNDETLSTSRNDVSEVPKIFVQNDDKMMLKFIADFRRMMESVDLKKVPESDDPRFSAPNTVYHLSEMLPGNKQMSTAYPDKKEETVHDLGKIKNSFGYGVVEIKDGAKQKGKSETAFETLSIVDVKRMAEGCVSLCDAIINYKLQYVERERRIDRFLKETQSASKTADEIDATTRQALTSIVTGATTINKNMMNGEGRWIRYVMDIVVSTLDWCTTSLAQYDHGKM